jgi:hypothetical protein
MICAFITMTLIDEVNGAKKVSIVNIIKVKKLYKKGDNYDLFSNVYWCVLASESLGKQITAF